MKGETDTNGNATTGRHLTCQNMLAVSIKCFRPNGTKVACLAQQNVGREGKALSTEVGFGRRSMSVRGCSDVIRYPPAGLLESGMDCIRWRPMHLSNES